MTADVMGTMGDTVLDLTMSSLKNSESEIRIKSEPDVHIKSEPVPEEPTISPYKMLQDITRSFYGDAYFFGNTPAFGNPSVFNPLTGSSQLFKYQNEKEPTNSEESSQSTSDDKWYESEKTLKWINCKVALYNPIQKMFKCINCDSVGYLTKVAEHWLAAHANMRVFQCPRCPYSSAWSRCVRMHLARQHNEQGAENDFKAFSPVLDEVISFLHALKDHVDGQLAKAGITSDKKYCCPICAYATDRKDLYTRHENIHKDKKPYHCYMCFKQFNRADHVKKHFLRIHKNVAYEQSLIRKAESKMKDVAAMAAEKRREEEEEASRAGTSGFKLRIPMVQSISKSSSPLPSSASKSTPSPLPTSSTQTSEDKSINNDDNSLQEKTGTEKEKKFSCNYCTWKGVDNWCLKRHLNTHIKPYVCALCNYKASRSERLTSHVFKTHRKRICHKCSFLADDLPTLQRHIQEEHKSGKNGIPCKDCGKVFDGRSEMETHCVISHGKKLKDCRLCDYKTTDHVNLEDHFLQFHGESIHSSHIGESICYECGLQFDSTETFLRHQVVHDSSQHKHFLDSSLSFICAVCGVTCQSQSGLVEHDCIPLEKISLSHTIQNGHSSQNTEIQETGSISATSEPGSMSSAAPAYQQPATEPSTVERQEDSNNEFERGSEIGDGNALEQVTTGSAHTGNHELSQIAMDISPSHFSNTAHLPISMEPEDLSRSNPALSAETPISRSSGLPIADCDDLSSICPHCHQELDSSIRSLEHLQFHHIEGSFCHLCSRVNETLGANFQESSKRRSRKQSCPRRVVADDEIYVEPQVILQEESNSIKSFTVKERLRKNYTEKLSKKSLNMCKKCKQPRFFMTLAQLHRHHLSRHKRNSFPKSVG